MKNLINQIPSLFFIFALIITTGSCSLMKSREPAEAAVANFHIQYNDGQFREIYSQADNEFKKSASEEQLLQLLETARRKLGMVKQSTQTKWNVNATTSGTLITLTYDVEFSEGKGTEQFVWRMNEDRALLYNYNVNSPLLITR